MLKVTKKKTNFKRVILLPNKSPFYDQNLQSIVRSLNSNF